jgi:uncharacterized protein (TIGR02118 family)
MIHITATYPNSDGVQFDHEYYRDKHFGLLRARFGDALKRAEVDQALSGVQPDVKPSWIVKGHLFFDSVEAFQAAIAPHMAEILGDIPNFTNVEPEIVISESTEV